MCSSLLPVLLVVNVGVYCFQVSSYTKLMALTVSITVISGQTKQHFLCVTIQMCQNPLQ